jgi:hypothetical protein
MLEGEGWRGKVALNRLRFRTASPTAHCPLNRISHQHVGWVKQTVLLVGLRSRTRTLLEYNVFLA